MKVNISTIKKLIVVPFCLCLVFCVPSCKNDDMLRVGFLSNLTHAQAVYLSNETCFFDNYDVDMYAFNAGPAIIESMRAEQLNIAYIGPVPAINGYVSSNKNIKIIAGVTNAGSLLVTRKGINISSVGELSGLTVAVPQFGNTQDIILRQLLKNASLELTENGGTVELIQQDNANIKNLMIKGDIDAALVPEPWGTRLVAEAEANILLDYDDIFGGNYPVTVLVVRCDYLEDNREKVKAFLKEHMKITEKIVNSDKSMLAEEMNDAMLNLTGVGIDYAVLRRSFDRMKFDYNVNEEALALFVEMCIDQGIIKNQKAVADIVDTSLLEEILSETGAG